MKRPNGSGGVRKLSGKRRHPYQVVVSAGHELRNDKICVKQVSLGCYATRKEALDALAEWQTNHLRVDLRYMTVKNIWDKVRPLIKHSVALTGDSIYKHYESIGNMRIVDVRTYNIEEVPLPFTSQSYHEKIRAFWHHIFEWAIENDIVNKDYSQYIRFPDAKPRRKKTALSPEDVDACIDVPLYKTLLYTGMRIGELLSMKSEQVYEEDGILCFHVLESKTEAGKRIIPVHRDLDLDLSHEYVIYPHKRYDQVKYEFYDYSAEHNMAEHTLHDFRRTFASYAKSCGCDEYYTKCLLGHAHNDITHDVYTQAFIKDLKREIDKIVYLRYN